MLSEKAERRLAENPTFQRAWLEVVVESSPDTATGLVVFDDWGRWISVEGDTLCLDVDSDA